MRAAAEMKKQMAPPGGNSGRGMMGIVLPMYAVGIVIYLIYTLTKVPSDLSVISQAIQQTYCRHPSQKQLKIYSNVALMF